MKRTRNLFSALALACMLSIGATSPAAASIGTFRTNLWPEMEEISLKIQEINWMKDIMSNLEGLKAIEDIKKLYSQAQEYLNVVQDLYSQVEGMKGQLESMASSMQSSLNGLDMSSVLDTGMLNGNVLGGIAGGTGTSDSDISKLTDLLQGGLSQQAAQLAHERSKEAIKEQLGVAKSGDVKQQDAAKTAMVQAEEAVALSFPGVQEGMGKLAANAKATVSEKRVYALNAADQGRMDMIQSIAKIMAPYTVSPDAELSYRKPLAKLEEQNKEALKKLEGDSGVKTNDSEALRGIAALSAVMVEQMGLQNQILVRWADILADDIKMNGVLALIGIEPYTSSVQDNLLRYIEVYTTMTQK